MNFITKLGASISSALFGYGSKQINVPGGTVETPAQNIFSGVQHLFGTPSGSTGGTRVALSPSVHVQNKHIDNAGQF